MQPTVRVELDGDYALVLPEIIHRTSKLLQKKVIGVLGREGYQSLQDELRQAANDEDRKVILRKVPIEGEDEIILLNQVVEWSFGDVSQEVLDNIPATKYDKLSAEVDRLYSSIPLVRT